MIIKDNFCYFCIKTYIVTPHLNRLVETVQMRGHNIPFRWEITKIFIKYCLLSRALSVVDNTLDTNVWVARSIPHFSGLSDEPLNQGPSPYDLVVGGR